jgi:hypothetical protein
MIQARLTLIIRAVILARGRGDLQGARDAPAGSVFARATSGVGPPRSRRHCPASGRDQGGSRRSRVRTSVHSCSQRACN